jgi:hypothetical protein
MIIRDGGRKTKIPNGSPYADAIRLLMGGFQAASLQGAGPTAPPARNDIKQLWRELDDRHRNVLKTIAAYTQGILQEDLETKLGIGWEDLRGRNIGLSRICSRLDVEYPIRSTGYNRDNRRFYLDPDVAKTVLDLSKRQP